MEEKIIVWDVISYYGYLPATFVYQDWKLSYLDDDETSDLVKQKTWYVTAPNGARVFKTSMGVAIMYTPYFIIADLLASKLGYEANGYTAPYAFSLIVATVMSLIIGLFFLRKLLLRYYSDWVCTFTLLIVAIGTNLLPYSTEEAGMSHAFSFCLFSIFLYLTEKWYSKQSYKTSIFLGLTAGLISLVRPTNCIIFIVFLLWGITNLESVKVRWQLYRKNIVKLIITALCIGIVWIPQLVYWKYLTGQWFFYSYNDNERFFFNDPRIWSVLFGFRKGLFIYTPVMLFALAGIVLLWKYNKKWAIPCSIFFVLNIYIISSWWCWWYGGSLGMRAMIDCYPIMAIGLACCLNWVSQQKKLYKIPLIIVISAFSLQSVIHTIQRHYDVLHYDSMTKEAYMLTFWKFSTPPGFYDVVKEPDYDEAKKGNRKE